jgi:hypothetical protein
MRCRLVVHIAISFARLPQCCLLTQVPLAEIRALSAMHLESICEDFLFSCILLKSIMLLCVIADDS